MNERLKLLLMGMIALPVFMILFSCSTNPDIASTGPSNAVDNVSIDEISLAAPYNEAEKTYLGLSGEEEFKIGQIKAQAVLIHIFSSTCPHCKEEAPNTNLLFKTIEQNPGLKNKIKILGIGLRDSLPDIHQFKKEFDVPFPLFPDEDSSLGERLKITGTPTMIGVKLDDNGSSKILLRKAGSIGEIPWFIDFLIGVFQIR